MGILSWIVLGFIAGLLAKFFMPIAGGLGFIKTILLGIVGAIVGGYISTFFGWGSVNGFNFSSILISFLGAVLVLYVYRLLKK
ncbi:GlsB/YeaQ/YmgE family stress response membrane protein [Zophobihabitans entericus]|uniref:GlsB/YeaQ/YmgE family stress response membrane protein n=1 Tax=Zophobihabitans entericus TaxID=1635327 RepID=A0A6G9I8S1_9GAMM|nr:GlsB/YeaQ/YmgE family stress response membrane protein [Zophobihabitans entericus]QIQ20222.1 GlsB/YeaQ/YmgE family stress response membrane protein [Zophobihabitans entericus]